MDYKFLSDFFFGSVGDQTQVLVVSLQGSPIELSFVPSFLEF